MTPSPILIAIVFISLYSRRRSVIFDCIIPLIESGCTTLFGVSFFLFLRPSLPLTYLPLGFLFFFIYFLFGPHYSVRIHGKIFLGKKEKKALADGSSILHFFIFYFSQKKYLFFWRVCVSARMLGAGLFSFPSFKMGGDSGAPALGYWLACWFRRGGFR